MTFPIGSETFGMRFSAVIPGVMVLFLATTAIAQDAANSGQIDSDVYNLFLSTAPRSRRRRPHRKSAKR